MPDNTNTSAHQGSSDRAPAATTYDETTDTILSVASPSQTTPQLHQPTAQRSQSTAFEPVLPINRLAASMSPPVVEGLIHVQLRRNRPPPAPASPGSSANSSIGDITRCTRPGCEMIFEGTDQAEQKERHLQEDKALLITLNTAQQKTRHGERKRRSAILRVLLRRVLPIMVLTVQEKMCLASIRVSDRMIRKYGGAATSRKRW